MTITAAICEVSGWEEIEDFAESRREFFAKRLDLSNGIPSHDTINRFFQIIDKKVYANWMSEMSRKIDSLTISIDLLAILYPSVVNIDASDVVF